MEKVNLNKGDKCFVTSVLNANCKKMEGVIKFKRNYRFGRAAYFVEVNGELLPFSFDTYGCRNFRDWQDAVWCHTHYHLFATEEEADKCIKASKKVA